MTPRLSSNGPQRSSGYPCCGDSSGSGPEQQDGAMTTRVDNTDSGMTPKSERNTEGDNILDTDLNAAIRELAQVMAHMIADTKKGDHVGLQGADADGEPTHETSHAGTRHNHENGTHHEKDSNSANQDDVIGRITPRRVPVSEANFTGFSGNRP